jgi:hypothetical protein
MAPRVHHFIVRPEVIKRLPTGLAVEQALVPLIPFDELPEWLDIIGVPRNLTVEQAKHLTNLGCYDPQGMHDVELIIDEPESGASDAGATVTSGPALEAPSSAVSEGNAKPHGLQQSRWADSVDDDSNTVPDKPGAMVLPALTTAVHPADRMMAHISPGQPPLTSTAPSSGPNSTACQAPPLPPASNDPTPGVANTPSVTIAKASSHNPSSSATVTPKKRVHCRHWVHHGTCKWAPFCRFAHKMPATLAGLAEVGLDDFPSWWTVAMAATLSIPPMGGREIRLPYHHGMDSRIGIRPGTEVEMGYGAYEFPPYGQHGHGRLSGYAALGALGRYGGVNGGGYVTKVVEREIHPRETGRVRRAKGGLGLQGSSVTGVQQTVREKETGVGEVLIGHGTMGTVQSPAVVQGSVFTAGQEGKSRDTLEHQMRQEAEVAQVRLKQVQQKLVDV